MDKTNVRLLIVAKSKYILVSSKRWFLYSLTPFVSKYTEKIVALITEEDGSREWASLKQSNRWSKYIIWTLVSVSSFAIFWALLAKIDDTVQASGKLEPYGTTLDVKAPLGGVIKSILVTEGQFVEKDQVLIILDTTAAKARLQALVEVKEKTLADLLLSKSRLGINIDQAQLSENQNLKLQALRGEFNSRIEASENAVTQAEESLQSIEEQLNAKTIALKIREDILEEIKPLGLQGAMSRLQIFKESQEVALLRGEVMSLTANKRRALASISEAKNKLKNTKSLSLIDFTTKVEETQKQIAQLTNQISEAKLTLQYQEIRSPRDGIIFDLQPSATGYVVNSERPILKVVPVDQLVARVFVSNREIGFVKPGQPAKIRVDAFPYNEFGELDGRILSIGSDVLEPSDTQNYYRFPITVSLDSSYLNYRNRRLPLITGMSVTANIVLRQRPVIALFTDKIFPFWDSLEQM